MCPADTPEGEACGLVKNLALLAHVTCDDMESTDGQGVSMYCIDVHYNYICVVAEYSTDGTVSEIVYVYAAP